uniref:Pecanex-like protein n=1 Tax=Toxocara canis TaxID=6265 RepID=A0A183U430_TOXCA
LNTFCSTPSFLSPANQKKQSNPNYLYIQNNNRPPGGAADHGVANACSPPYGFITVLNPQKQQWERTRTADDDGVVAVLKDVEDFWGYDLASKMKNIWEPSTPMFHETTSGLIPGRQMKTEIGDSWALLIPLRSIWAPGNAERVTLYQLEYRGHKSKQLNSSGPSQPNAPEASNAVVVEKTIEKQVAFDFLLSNSAKSEQTRQIDDAQEMLLRQIPLWLSKKAERPSSSILPEVHSERRMSPKHAWYSAMANADGTVQHCRTSAEATFEAFESSPENVRNRPRENISGEIQSATSRSCLDGFRKDKPCICGTNSVKESAFVSMHGSQAENNLDQRYDLWCTHSETQPISTDDDQASFDVLKNRVVDCIIQMNANEE